MRVLVVEDEPLIRDLIVEQLTDAGYEVIERGNADDAIVLLLAAGSPRSVPARGLRQ